MQPRSGAFTIDIIKRILNVLHEQGRIKRTNLACKVGLNYQGCMRYIKFLSMLKWVDFDEGHVTITLIGKQFRHILNEGEMYAGQIDSSIFDIAEQIAHKKKSSQETATAANVSTGSASSRPSSSQSTRIKTSQNILLVDNDEGILLTFKKFLQSEGYTVTALSDAKKAMERFAVASSSSPACYDLVITDIRMSPLNGLLLHQAIKALDQKVKVIFVTALDAADELTSIYGLPSTCVVKKPVTKENFIRAVRLALHDTGSHIIPSASLAANQRKPPF
jgi:CheY-like chemotaxis protein/predicted transcriptional regulator